MKKIFLIICVILLSTDMHAQWNSNPSENTFVAGTLNLRTNCRIIGNAEGEFYIASWEAVPDTSMNFEFWLQRLNFEGYRQWGDNGILISNHPSRTWLSGYDMAMDAEGNVIMAIEDMRSGDGFSHVSLYSYDPDGQPVWNADGIQVDTGSYASYSPVLTVTPAGNIFIAWNCIYNEGPDEQYAIRIKKYGPDGIAQWAGAKEFTGPDSTFIYPELVNVGEDDVIIIWQKKFRVGVGISEMWFSYILAQRFDSYGMPVWDTDVIVCDHGDSAYLMPQYLEISLAKDENDGIFLCWNDGRFDPVVSNAFVQYLSADGTFRWPQNGIAVSPVNIGHHRTFPLVACDDVGQNAYIIWNERQSTNFGLCGQKILSDGSLAWGELGITFRDFTPDTMCLIAKLDLTSSGDLLALDYIEYLQTAGFDTTSTDLLSAYRITSSGELVWSPGKLKLSTSTGIKSVPVLSESIDDMYVISWVENREMPMIGFGSVYAQNFDLVGNIGPLYVKEDIEFGDEMIIYPNPATNVLYVHLNDRRSIQQLKVGIFDSLGRQVFMRQCDGSLIEIDVSRLNDGVYIVRVETEELSVGRKLVLLH